VDGIKVGGLGRALGATNAQGRTEMTVPAGAPQVWAFKVTGEGGPRLGGSTTVTLASGQSATVAIRLVEGATEP
jgi:hypothetical protein